LRKMVRRYGKYFLVTDQDLDRSLDTFEKHGDAVIFFGRLIPGVRSLISIPAGLRSMDLKRFLAFTLMGSTLWNIVMAGAGYFLGSNWRQVLEFMDTYETIILIAGLALLLIFLVTRLRTRGRRKAAIE
jgi:membrane protein DedA with SNARE-associated domain